MSETPLGRSPDDRFSEARRGHGLRSHLGGQEEQGDQLIQPERRIPVLVAFQTINSWKAIELFSDFLLHRVDGISSCVVVLLFRLCSSTSMILILQAECLVAVGAFTGEAKCLPV